MHINRLSGLPTLEHATYNCPWEKQSVFRSIPHYSNDCPWALLMVIANRTFPVSPSSFIYTPVPPSVPVVVVSLCPGRHSRPSVPVCNFSLSVAVVIYIPCVPVVICVPVSWSVISLWVFWSSFIFRVPVVICVPVLCWWWLLIEHSLCPGRFLFECPGRHLYSLCPVVPVVICVPMSRSVISSVDKHDVSLHTNMTSLEWHTDTLFLYI